MSEIEENKSKPLIFSFQDPYQESNIVKPTESEVRGYEWVSWGDRNAYPEYLNDLYQNVPVLQSLINGCTDYTCGDDIVLNVAEMTERVNPKGDTINDLVRQIVFDFWKYGAFAINVVRTKAGGISGLYYLNVRNVRSDKKNSKFYYSEDWSKSWGRIKYVEYPKFGEENDASSILFVKNNWNGTYGVPVYAASTVAAECMKATDEYELNSIMNGFMASYIISLNNGQPTPEIQAEIEKELNEKFAGASNAGRIMLSFNKSKDNEVTVQKIEQPDFADKFKELQKWTRQQLFTSFRAAPQLFGIPTEQNGFSSEDYLEAYKLFNKTMIRPVQRKICDAFKMIFSTEVLEIQPFSIDWSEDSETDNNTLID